MIVIYPIDCTNMATPDNEAMRRGRYCSVRCELLQDASAHEDRSSSVRCELQLNASAHEGRSCSVLC